MALADLERVMAGLLPCHASGLQGEGEAICEGHATPAVRGSAWLAWMASAVLPLCAVGVAACTDPATLSFPLRRSAAAWAFACASQVPWHPVTNPTLLADLVKATSTVTGALHPL